MTSKQSMSTTTAILINAIDDVKYNSIDSSSADKGSNSSTSSSSNRYNTGIFCMLCDSNKWSMSTISNTCNALLGVSIFTVPWGFSQAGLLGGVIVLAFVASISYGTATLMLSVQRELFLKTRSIRSYPEIASIILGSNWSIIVKYATVVSCIGGNVGYVIFLGQIFEQVCGLSFTSAVLILTIPLVFLSWIRSFKDMAVFTLFGNIAVCISILAIIIDAYEKSIGNSINSDHISAPLINYHSAFNMLGPSTFLFTIHYCILSMGSESLRDEYRSYHPLTTVSGNNQPPYIAALSENGISNTFMRSLGLSYIISTSLIVLLGGYAYYFYRYADYVYDINGNLESGCDDVVCQNVILNLSSGTIKNTVECSLIVAITFSYVIILAPAREHIESFVMKCIHPSSSECDVMTRNITRTGIVLATSYIAIVAPYFGTVLGMIGGLTDTLQSFVLPPLIYLHLNVGSSSGSSYNKIFVLVNRIVLLFGFCTMTFTFSKLCEAVYSYVSASATTTVSVAAQVMLT